MIHHEYNIHLLVYTFKHLNLYYVYNGQNTNVFKCTVFTRFLCILYIYLKIDKGSIIYNKIQFLMISK